MSYEGTLTFEDLLAMKPQILVTAAVIVKIRARHSASNTSHHPTFDWGHIYSWQWMRRNLGLACSGRTVTELGMKSPRAKNSYAESATCQYESKDLR